MINVSETKRDDIPQIAEWIAADPWHSDDPKWSAPENMITGYGLISFCLEDESGPVAYIQLLDDGSEYARVAAQFGPEDQVSKRRVAKGLAHGGFAIMLGLARGYGKKGIIFESFSPLLIEFVKRNGFVQVGETNDYLLAPEGQNDV